MSVCRPPVAEANNPACIHQTSLPAGETVSLEILGPFHVRFFISAVQVVVLAIMMAENACFNHLAIREIFKNENT